MAKRQAITPEPDILAGQQCATAGFRLGAQPYLIEQ
jgi:hypothetical protein